MDKLYRETKSKLLEISDLLGKYETSARNESEALNKEKITSKFNEITAACDQLDIYVTKEPALRKYDAKMKVDQLKYDFQHLKAAFNTIQYKK
jgi:Golgi SNAP receptor complex protein 2